MNPYFEIKPNKSGRVRTNLCLEDVHFPNFNVLVEFGLIIVDDSLGENVLVFKEPFRVPRFNRFYASRIKAIEDPYLYNCIRRLLYLNPNPDKLMIKKLTEFILLHFTAMEMVESEVRMGHLVPKPVLQFSEVEAAVTSLAMLQNDSDYIPDNEDSVMFKRESSIAKEDKIRLRAYYRANQVKELLERAIHTVAEHLIEAQEQIKVTHTRIESTKMVTTKKGPASVRTIRKYMSERTRRIIEEHNSYAPFATETTMEKYYCYLSMDEESTLTEISESLDISRSTASQFRRIRNENEIPQEIKDIEVLEG